MARFHQPLTWLSLALSTIGLALVLFAPGPIASILFLLAQIGALAEFKKYTGRFQFGMIIGSAGGLGLSIDLVSGSLILATVPMVLSALAIVLRQAYLPVFTYVNKRWMEPLLLCVSTVPLSLLWVTVPFTWSSHLFPLVTFGSGVFSA